MPRVNPQKGSTISSPLTIIQSDDTFENSSVAATHNIDALKQSPLISHIDSLNLSPTNHESFGIPIDSQFIPDNFEIQRYSNF